MSKVTVDSIDIGRELAERLSNLDHLALAVMCDELTIQNKEKADWIANLLDRLVFDKDIQSSV